MKEFTYENDDGEEIVVEFPTIMEVCSECEGHGTHLAPGMKGHAYSAEEFAESFDDEERHEYFKRGGRYDVTCTVCHGKNVVAVIDEEQCEKNPDLAAALEIYHEHQHEEADYRRTVEAERRMGC